MNKSELTQTAKNILWLFLYLFIVALCSALLFFLEMNQEHIPSDVGIPAGFLDGVFAFLFTCVLIITAVVLWMIRMGRYLHLEGMGRTYRIVNRIIQWIPMLAIFIILGIMIKALSRLM